MPHDDSVLTLTPMLPEVLLLVALGCQTTAPQIERQLTTSTDEVARILTVATQQGFLSAHSEDPGNSSFALTTDGTMHLHAHLDSRRPRLTPRPSAVMQKFGPLDRKFKTLALRLLEEPTDQRGIISLDGVVGKALPLLDSLIIWGARFSGYRIRLEAAANQVLSGRHQYLIDPSVDNAHTVWWEWHSDMKLVIGERGSA